MEVDTIRQLAVVACLWITLIFQSIRGQTDCPLQCSCESVPGGLAVKCRKPTFSQLPAFPPSTTIIAIQYHSKISKVYGDALSGLHQLKSFNLVSSVTWEFETGVFDNKPTMEALSINSHVPNKLPEDVLRGLNLEKLRISLHYNVLPFTSICSQENLSRLNLGYNTIGLLSLPKCMTKFGALIALILSNNHLTNLGQSDFAVLHNSKLKILSLSRCKISFVHGQTFQPLIHITDISLDHNRVRHLPQNIFRNLRNLSTINISYNWFTKIPCDIFKLAPALSQLLLQNLMRISDEFLHICPEYASIPRLYEVHMENTFMSNINDTTLLPLREVRSLWMTVRSISKGALAAVPHLNSLRLIGGRINLTGLTNAVIGLNQTSIRKLIVKQAQNIDSLPDDLFSPLRFSLLTSLTLYKCYFYYVGQNTFSPLSKLQMLDLGWNSIRFLHGGTFRHLANMKTLILSHNAITDFIVGPHVPSWELPRSLQTLKIDYNSIRTIHRECLQGLGNLTHLNLESNQVDEIFEDSLISASLQQINLARNDIKTFHKGILAKAPELRDIDLSSNNIVLTEHNIFHHVFSLIRLDLQDTTCSITCELNLLPVIFRRLENLQYIDLANFKIASLPPETFLGNGNLRHLVISANKLSYWNPVAFRPLENLNNLDLSRNQIMTISKSSFKYLTSLRILGLAANPLYCNCDLLWFREWLPQANVYIPSINSNGYKCEGPAKYRDVQLLDFNPPESECRSYTFLKLSVTFAAAVLLVVTTAGIMYR